MRVERTFLDASTHPSRRRVKYLPIAAAKDQSGHVINTEMIGDYPILWSRRVGDGELLIVMLADESTGRCMTSRISEADLLKLPETDIEW